MRVLSLALAFAGLSAPLAASAVPLYVTIDVKNDRRTPAIVSVSNSSCKPFAAVALDPRLMVSYRCLREDLAQGKGVTIVARVHTGRDVICEGLWRESTATVRGGSCTLDNLGSDRYSFVVK